ncbi:MAG TPA: type II secretion system minor pseudopilin GspK [Myxococcales bacterium]|nr:type II secretion system minor pseudopilin GspK [Myxococcales bacterium]
MRSAPVQQRGVALILVLTTLAILTAVGVDFSYNSRVSLKLAENLRDEMRAEYMAKSAINLSRLLLHFQKQLDQMGGQIGGILQSFLGGGSKTGTATAGSATPGPTNPGMATPAASNNLGIRLWELLPIDSNAFNALLSRSISGLEAARKGESAPSPLPPVGPRAVSHSFGAFDGSFNTKIVDENSRINVQQLDGYSDKQTAVLTQLRAMMADPKYDFIFDEPDANRDRVRRDDVILAMTDWIDNNDTAAVLDLANPRNPIAKGFGDENSAYQRYEPRYKAKNGHFDSLEELYMVRGVNDRFMAAFADRLTIWPDINTNLNVNTNDPQQMLTNILIAAANPYDPALRDPRLLATILREIQIRKLFSFMGLAADDFVSILLTNGIKLRPEIVPGAGGGKATNLFGSTSDTFRITATGRVGRIEKQITAVVRYDDGMGKLLYWKED